MKISQKTIQSDKGDIILTTLTNSRGASVTLSSLGAGIVSIIVPDGDGALADVVLGYENPTDYLYDGPCAGKTPGRYANRIARGKLRVDGISYKLDCNCGPNHLHGGPEGFQNQIWLTSIDGNSVVFRLTSPDGDENYPGKVDVTVKYTWTDDCRLIIEYHATSDATTVINLTNHTYFNLSGHDSGCALNHLLKLNCSAYLETDDSLAPTGRIVPVKDTPMDFTRAKSLRKDIKEDFTPLRQAKGYDHCLVVDEWEPGKLSEVAVLTDEASGRAVVISSTQPAAQIYTGNWLTGSPKGKGGYEYSDYDCVAIECQGYPDAPNHENFPSQSLSPGKDYEQTIIYHFKTL